MDFDFIESGVEMGAPKYMEWYGHLELGYADLVIHRDFKTISEATRSPIKLSLKILTVLSTL